MTTRKAPEELHQATQYYATHCTTLYSSIHAFVRQTPSTNRPGTMLHIAPYTAPYSTLDTSTVRHSTTTAQGKEQHGTAQHNNSSRKGTARYDTAQQQHTGPARVWELPAHADACDPTLPAPPDALPHFSTALKERGREGGGLGLPEVTSCSERAGLEL